VGAFKRRIRDLDLLGDQSTQQRGPPKQGFEPNRSEAAIPSEFVEQAFGAIGVLRERHGEEIPFTLEIVGIDLDPLPGGLAGESGVEHAFANDSSTDGFEELGFDFGDGDAFATHEGDRTRWRRGLDLVPGRAGR